MRHCTLWSALACLLLAATLSGCAQRPLTDSEFRGFCYTNIGKRTSCDTFSICDAFDNDVLQVKHASRADCAKGCAAIYDRLYGPNMFEGCDATVQDAFGWCMKFCNTNYPQ